MALQYKSQSATAGSYSLTNDPTATLDPQWWRLVHLQATIVASATVGNRRLVAEILDASNNIVDRAELPIDVTAGQTKTAIWSLAAQSRETAFDGGNVAFTYLPRQFIQPNFKLRVRDRAGISGSDTLEIYAMLSIAAKAKIDEGSFFVGP